MQVGGDHRLVHHMNLKAPRKRDRQGLARNVDGAPVDLPTDEVTEDTAPGIGHRADSNEPHPDKNAFMAPTL